MEPSSLHTVTAKLGWLQSWASVLFYIECWTRINGNLACTQEICSWILPTYAKAVPYARVRDIDFTSAKRPREKLYHKIDSFTPTSQDSALPSHEETEVEQDSVLPLREKTTVAEGSALPSHEETDVKNKAVSRHHMIRLR
ncbi:Hypp4543 [Branchiostoma lanceolatum]|uniref:Hypp4543 protein n=1 Tax=Branchiostoma lanceolatum TaxID=7740 RepID=A0A8K0A916_BRALA|nr:Hypp4543 [Branchiostoma lanceolatum]